MSICTISYPHLASQFGAASVAFIFIFTLIYSSTFLLINFNYPAEVRGRGMALGIMGWSIGLGCGTLYNPIMFQNMGGKGFFIFAGLNLLFFVLVYLFIPETSGRSLEAINTLFEADKPFNRSMEKRYREMRAQGRIGDEESTDSQEKAEVEEVRRGDVESG
jgi:MFS family permease